MAAPPAQNEVGLKESFYRNFQHGVATLQEQMVHLSQMSTLDGARNDALDQCLAGIDRLSHDVKDASSYLPAYDQRTYSQTIKTLSEKLQSIRNSFDPPKKFSFKARKTASKAPTNVRAEDDHVPIVTPNTFQASMSSEPTREEKLSPGGETEERKAAVDPGAEHDEIEAGSGIRRPSFSKSTKVTISKHTGLHIILPASASHATSSGTISSLQRCVVDLSPSTINGAPFDVLYLKNIKDSLIICGQVAGAIHITDIENSVIVIACRQFRMHGSKNVDVYLHSTSRPIFEDCEGLRFAPLPGTYLTPSISQSANQWDQID
ncbi:TBCC-domain-containing protein, partial [Decorospora gaudefroyi]